MQKFSLTVLRNSAFGMGAQLAIKVLSFGFSVAIVRTLGAQAFGQYSAVLAFGATLTFLADLGLSPYAVRQVAQWRDAPDGGPSGLERTRAFYGSVLALRLALSFVTALLLIALAWLTGRPPVMIGAIALGTLGLLMYGVQGTSDAVLAGYERLDLSAGARVLNQLVFVFLGAAALIVGLGYYGLILANLVAIAAMTLVCWRAVKRLGVQPARATVKGWTTLLRASFPFGVIGLALGLSYKFDSVLLNIFRGDAETGYYNAAYNLVFSAAVFSNAINTALYPSLTREAASAPHRLPRIYERALRYLLLASLPVAVGVWALADQIVVTLFKAAYLPAAPALQIVIWVVPLMYASEFLGYIVLVNGQERRAARAIVTSSALNVAVNLLLVPRFGFLAAAAMTVITEAVLVGQYVWMLRATVRQMDWGHTLVRPLLAAAVMGVVVLALRGQAGLWVNAALGAGVYALCLLALGVVGKDEVSLARGALSARRAAKAGAAQ